IGPHSLLQLYLAGFIQHTVPAVAIAQIASDGQCLPRNIPALLSHRGANLHCRSPLSLVLLSTSITWERTPHPVRRPAFSSRLITTVTAFLRRKLDRVNGAYHFSGDANPSIKSELVRTVDSIEFS